MSNINNTTKKTTIKGSSGADTIANYAGGVYISAAGGNDYIYTGTRSDYTINNGWGYVTIDAGDGNDSINAFDDHLSVNGGAGNDSITIQATSFENITVKGGTGNDYIYNSANSTTRAGHWFQYFHGDGNDTIVNYSANDTISIGSYCYYSTVNSGNDVIVSIAGSGSMLLKDAKGKKINITDIAKNPIANPGTSNFIWNYTPDTTVNGTSSNDTIRNHAGGAYVSGGAGNDNIWNGILYNYTSDNPATISGGRGNDAISIYNSEAVLLYSPGDGYDTIYYADSDDTISIASGNYVTGTASDGADALISLESGGYMVFKNTSISNLNIRGGSTSASLVSNSKSYFSIKGTESYDIIINSGANVTINALAGNDTIANYGEAVRSSIYTGEGDDLITNHASLAVVNGGFDNDTISNSNIATYAYLFGGSGNDSIKNSAIYAEAYGSEGNDTIANTSSAGHNTLSGGDGDDYFSNQASYVSIFGGAGNDTILFGGSLSGLTINGGTGDDFIYGDSVSSYGAIYQFQKGDGADTIRNFNSNDTISLGANENYSTVKSGNNFVVSLSSGSMTLINAANSSVKISGGKLISNQNYIENYTKNITLTGTANADTITNYAGGVYISASGGDDSIYNATDTSHTINNAFGYVTIDGGSGNDTIYNSNSNVSIRGDFGDDFIMLNSSSATNNTINASYGNDYIYMVAHSAGNRIQYYSGNGYDTVYGYTAKDTLSMIVTQFATLESGNDVIVTVPGSGGMTLLNAKGKTLNFTTANNTSGTKGLNVTVAADNATVTGSQNNDTIRNNYNYSNVLISGGNGNDSISLDGLGAPQNNTIIGGGGNDTIELSISSKNNLIQYSPSEGNDVIIGLDSDDTLHITEGSVTGASVNGNDIVLTVASGTTKGTVTLKNNVHGIDNAFNLKIGSAAAKSTIISSYPAGISISGTTLTASTAYTGNLINLGSYPSSVTNVDASALSRGVSIVGTSRDNYIKGGKGADTIYGGAGNDTVSLGGGNDVYVYGYGNDLILDYTAGADKIKLSNYTISGASVLGSDVILKMSTGNNSLTVKNGKGKKITVIDNKGNETSRVYGSYNYDSKHSTLTLAASFTGTLLAGDYDSTVKKIDASQITSATRIDGNAQANTILGGYNADTIYGGAGNDSLDGGAGNDKIYGNSGNDTLWGGTDNDTLWGGAGNDVFIYANGYGKDVIADYETGDKITLRSGTISGASVSGSDMVFSVGVGSLKVTNGKGKEISIGSNIYYNNLIYDSKKTAATLGAGFTGTLKATDYSSTVKKIDASTLTKAVRIEGNNQANSIIGGAGADTLTGGAGNDTLTGGKGNDVFLYSNGTGNDVIADFTTGDKISVSGSVASTSLKSSDMVLKIGTGSLTVKNGKGKDIPVGSFIFHDNLVYNATKTALILNTGFTGTLEAGDYDSKVKSISAQILTKGVAIEGNAQANSIIGGSGADTLFGGKGNDTLTGGKGSDTFVYTAGNDVITDYTAKQDKIQLFSAIKDVSYKNGDVIFKIGTGTLTVKNGDGKAITTMNLRGVSTTETYSSGGVSGGISGGNGIWFTDDDDNFISAENNLDAITEEKFAVTNIQTEEKSVAQDETFITYTEK